ncbi:zinc finger protein 276 isoform X3 [Siphateles boraxobius]|uniref:zinc finger protein 276 isoform X3 n=1 Tax=Siphateles boraxobius TaxID=180520 RepID=UPI00406415B2
MMKRRSRASKRARTDEDDAGRMSTGFCRLCHGKFSTRRLRQAFAQLQGEACGVYPLFCSDFQQLLGIPMDRDPALSQFICNTCHAQFYKCHSILLDFRNRVNLTPLARDRSSADRSSPQEDMALFRSHISSDRSVLHSLVSWAHTHASGCRSPPGLQEALEGPCRGALKLVWVCVDGHSYEMDTGSSAGTQCGDRAQTHTDQQRRDSSAHSPASVAASGTADGGEDTAPGAALLEDRGDVDSELSDRNMCSDEECDDRRKSGSSEDSSDLNADKREELPTIYKCPHQGCTAVYRGADGMKKHIKEHHEEVRERPCPHPGCNKVFMIDRYLQRHVKLIHTEVRNYICDQCGQTFKQRKHLSVHQMRHSGAKPLQCEVCGFQCRQRASLKYHMTKHKAEAELEFACVICGKRFEKAHNLNVHMSMVHPLLQGGSVPPKTTHTPTDSHQSHSSVMTSGGHTHTHTHPSPVRGNSFLQQRSCLNKPSAAFIKAHTPCVRIVHTETCFKLLSCEFYK